jgi:two-component system phosphate regulon response regulator PhoB
MDERVETAANCPQDHLIVVGDFLLDRETIRVWWGNRPLTLSLRQFRLMEYFMQHPQQPLSRRSIKEAIWGPKSTVEETTVDVEIVHLRRAIGGRKREAPIRTVRNQGYAFEVRRRRATTKPTRSAVDTEKQL